MSDYQNETIATHTINGNKYHVTLYWRGKEPSEDDGRFYDVFNDHGICLNEGWPLHEQPTEGEIEKLLELLELTSPADNTTTGEE